MYRRPTKRQEFIRRLITYTVMTLSVLTIVSGIVLILLGYRFDTDNGRIEQGALLQFETIPSGATVKVDGKVLRSKTPSKSSVLLGMHTFEIQKDGYQTWKKTLDIVAGTLTWLDYIRLVPKDIKVETVNIYTSVYGSLATSDGRTMIIQQTTSTPTFQIDDLRSDDVKESTITIPADIYSGASVVGVTHTFDISSWDSDGRYILLQHTYDGQKEWLVLDTKDVTRTRNITSVMSIDISSIAFSGSSGNLFYVLSGTDVRKLDLSSQTISRPLVGGVSGFEIFDGSVITYAGVNQADPTKRVLGFYSDGDDAPRVLRTIDDTTTSVNIATAHYFNQDYVAISEGSKVSITAGRYPASGSEDNSSLSDFASFTMSSDIDLLSFSPKGDYLLVRSGSDFASYDIEHQRVTNFSLPVAGVPIMWLDDDHTWSDYDNGLIIREFDGTNSATLNSVVAGQGVAITTNDKYIYSIGKIDAGYQLQRVRMQLP